MAFALALPAIKPPYSARERWLAAYRDWRRARWMLEPGQSPDDLARNTLRMAFAPPFQRPFSALFDRQAAAAAVPWYLAGGATGCVAAYLPKGAASLAASYVNLANPGTYDAASGVAPTWASGTGWTFNGTTQYLLTGILPVIDTSTICRFDSASGSASRALFGVSVSANNWRHYVRVREGGASRRWASGSSTVLMGGALTSGVVALCGSQAYLDGAPDATISRTWANPTIDIAIGAERTVAGAQAWYTGNIVAVAIYNTILSAAQVALISAAMAAL